MDRAWVGGKGGICVPSPWGAAGTRAVEVVVGAGVVFEEEEGNFQKLEELAGSALTTSLLLSGDVREAFEGERVSQVVRLFGPGFSLSVFSLSVAGLLSPTVALRVGVGFFFSVCFVSAGSSETPSFSLPIIHHESEDFFWILTDSVFLSSMSPIRRSQSKGE